MPDAMDTFRARRLGYAGGGLDETIHPDDEMLAVVADRLGVDSRARMSYLTMGADLAQVVEQLAYARFGADLTSVRVLEFASGYGRNVRHLVHVFPPQNITVSDIQEPAVAVCVAQFGVRGRSSVHDPAELAWEDRFDLVVVPSLFSHLPDASFGPWLRALAELLTEDGLLAFSVHGDHLQPPQDRSPDGISFAPESEIDSLDRAEYGTSHVSDAYVAGRLAEAVGPVTHVVVRRGFWGHQDLHLVARENDAALAAYRHRHGIASSLDVAVLTAEGHLELAGWATDVDDPSVPVQVRVTLDDVVVAEGPARVQRDQVAHACGPAHVDSGYWFLVPNVVRFHALDAVLLVEAVAGLKARCLWAGPLGVALTANRYAEARHGAATG
ncbi:MAG: putative methyltransferase [Solirubrobacterales bacterium]|nr:putative methyltransferase [Solirubrobacterales bacterium]